jgi:protein TonB
MDEPPTTQNAAQAGFRQGFSLPDRPRTRAAGFALTMLAHLGLLAAFLFGVRVAAPMMMDAKPLAVSIEKQVQEPPPILAMKPRLSSPLAIQVPVPEVTIQQPPPSPVTATYAPSVTAGAGKGGTGTGEATGCIPCYLEVVRKYLQAYVIYPREAVFRHVQGVVIIHFVSDRDGNLVSFDVANSSGHPVLDDAALALMKQAQKIPPIPSDLHAGKLNADIPIAYVFTATSVDSPAPTFGNGRFGR